MKILKITNVLICLMLFSCQKNQTFDETEKNIVDKPRTQYINNLKIETYIIDSCEYIGYVNATSHDFLTHKGNCKYCKERNEK